jgi:hypothetical protein
MARSLSCRFPSWQPENETLLREESSGRSHGGIRGPSRRQRISPARLAPRGIHQSRAGTSQDATKAAIRRITLGSVRSGA